MRRLVIAVTLLGLAWNLAGKDVLPNTLTKFYEKLGLMTTLPVPMSSRLPPFGLIRRKNRIPTPAMEMVAEALREESPTARPAAK